MSADVHDGSGTRAHAVPIATVPISEERIQGMRRGLEQGGGVGLLLVYEDGLELALLMPDEPLVVGRTAPSQVCIPDATLSHEHARFCLRADSERVLVEDLDSTNGLWIAGRSVTRAQLAVGDEIMLGAVLARVRRIGPEHDDADLADTGEDREFVSGALIAGTAMRALLATARRVANARIPVVLYGETGAGKEIVVRFIHEHGPRADQPIIRVNCGAIPSELVESSFFGHERGAFTGAQQARAGIFAAADKGTLFLDEIGELAHAAQVALLRVLETGTFTPVGATGERTVDVRVIAASHRNLADLVEAGTFRADLYYRLDAMTIEIPPLRARTDEIGPLARHFLVQANRANNRELRAFAPEVLALFQSYGWPGNVRELRNVVERAVVVADGDTITVRELPARLRATGKTAEPTRPRVHEVASPEPRTEPGAEPEPRGLRERMRTYEAELIRSTLDNTGWNREAAARLLDMPVRTLSYKIKQLGLDKLEPK